MCCCCLAGTWCCVAGVSGACRLMRQQQLLDRGMNGVNCWVLARSYQTCSAQIQAIHQRICSGCCMRTSCRRLLLPLLPGLAGMRAQQQRPLLVHPQVLQQPGLKAC